MEYLITSSNLSRSTLARRFQAMLWSSAWPNAGKRTPTTSSLWKTASTKKASEPCTTTNKAIVYYWKWCNWTAKSGWKTGSMRRSAMSRPQSSTTDVGWLWPASARLERWGQITIAFLKLTPSRKGNITIDLNLHTLSVSSYSYCLSCSICLFVCLPVCLSYLCCLL